MDIFELNDWIAEHQPDVYSATKFLHVSTQVEVWSKVYELHAKEATA